MSDAALVKFEAVGVPVQFTAVGLELPETLPFETWRKVGRVLVAMEGGVHWNIGDWLNYGERAYGEKYLEAEEVTGFAYSTLAHDKWVASQFRFWRRRQNLSWSHHREVATLPPTEQDRWLDLAEENGWSQRELRRQRQLGLLRDAPSLPTGKYRVIYADPPWAYGNVMPDYFGEQGDHYELMTVGEICALQVKELAEDNAVLFLWATSPILEEAFEVIRAWGFEYKTSFVWDKVKHVMGHYNSVRHEFLLVCVRGSCQPDIPKLFDSVVTEERREHSRKPDIFREMIDMLYPYGKRIELFARERVEGWDAYGYEVSRLEEQQLDSGGPGIPGLRDTHHAGEMGYLPSELLQQKVPA